MKIDEKFPKIQLLIFFSFPKDFIRTLLKDLEKIKINLLIALNRYEEDYSDLGRDPDLNDMRINPSTYSLHSLRRFDIIIIIVIIIMFMMIMTTYQERAKPNHNPWSTWLAKKCHPWTIVFKVIMTIVVMMTNQMMKILRMIVKECYRGV